MSERRQLALLFAGLVVLTAIGVVSATIFPEPCEELEQLGDIDVRFTDAADALPLSVAEGAAVEALGEGLGIGPWRGAVALPDDAAVSRSEFGFFVVTSDDYIVLRPSMGIASASRGRAGLDAIPVGTSLLLRAADGETAVVNGEYEVDRCGSLPPTPEVLTADRGFAVVGDEDEVELVTLSGDVLWTAPGTDLAHLVDDRVLLARDETIEVRELQSGDAVGSVDAVDMDGPSWAWAFADELLVPGDDEFRRLVVGEELALVPTGVDAAARPATGTPGGVVAALVGPGGPRLVTDRGGAVAVPAGLAVTELHASQDGHVGVLLRAATGERALAVYGPDR